MSSTKDTGKKGPAGHLASLFEEYDCVILPGIGGFLLHESPSILRREEQVAHPPSRIIKFNALLKDDDGLLTHTIARDESISFSEARKVVDHFIAEGLRTMQEWKAWELEGIGSFRLNREEKVVFSPDKDFNSLPSSFGLKPVSARRIKKADAGRAIMQKRVDRKPVMTREKTPGSVKWTVLTALPVIAFLLWGIISPDSVRSYYSGYSMLFADILHVSHPVKTGEITQGILIDMPDDKLPANDTPANHPATDPENGYRNDINSAPAYSESAMSGRAVESRQSADTAPAGLELPVLPPNVPARYYVIGGAFRESENAEKFLSSLERKGFKPEIAGANGSGHLRISYASFAKKSEALEFLNGIRKNESPGAWLLRY